MTIDDQHDGGGYLPPPLRKDEALFWTMAVVTQWTITEFLTARYDEIEAVAKAATQGRWEAIRHTASYDYGPPYDGSRVVGTTMWAVTSPVLNEDGYRSDVVEVESDRDYGQPSGGCDREENAVHIAAQCPDRVLADIAAKRAILAQCAEVIAEEDKRDTWDGWCDPTRRGDAEDVLGHLASVYADHPDYRSEWKP